MWSTRVAEIRQNNYVPGLCLRTPNLELKGILMLVGGRLTECGQFCNIGVLPVSNQSVSSGGALYKFQKNETIRMQFTATFSRKKCFLLVKHSKIVRFDCYVKHDTFGFCEISQPHKRSARNKDNCLMCDAM